MKTFIKSLALALSLGVVTSAVSIVEAKPIGRPTAIAAYKSGIYTSVGGKLNVALDKQTGGTVDVRLKGSDGKVMFVEHIGKNQTQYRTRLNLSELPDGVYQLEITNGVETTTQQVTIATEKPATPTRVVAIN